MTTTLAWKTGLTKSFPCRVPLMGAPMAGVSGGPLAAETCRAGGLGFIAAGHAMHPSHQAAFEALEREISLFRKLAPPDAPLCLGFLGHSTFGTPEGWNRYEQVLDRHRPAVVQFFAPAICYRRNSDNEYHAGGDCTSDAADSNVSLAHQYQAKVLAQVGSVADGEEALRAGVDGLIAQGGEAGGHGLRRELASGTLALAARLVQVANAADQPPVVLAAGGIADGRGVAAALALGCGGAVLGTRLWCSQEAMTNNPEKARKLQQLLVQPNITGDSVVHTSAFDTIQNTYTSTPWPYPYDSVGALRNATSDRWENKYHELNDELRKSSSANSPVAASLRQADQEGDGNVMAVLCGEGVGEINSVEPAHDIITRIDRETIHILTEKLTKLVIDEQK